MRLHITVRQKCLTRSNHHESFPSHRKLLILFLAKKIKNFSLSRNLHLSEISQFLSLNKRNVMICDESYSDDAEFFP